MDRINQTIEAERAVHRAAYKTSDLVIKGTDGDVDVGSIYWRQYSVTLRGLLEAKPAQLKLDLSKTAIVYLDEHLRTGKLPAVLRFEPLLELAKFVATTDLDGLYENCLWMLDTDQLTLNRALRIVQMHREKAGPFPAKSIMNIKRHVTKLEKKACTSVHFGVCTCNNGFKEWKCASAPCKCDSVDLMKWSDVVTFALIN